jgi:hypothetical protein
MTAFDKWFSKDGCFIPERGDAGYEGYVERRAAWKAALEWSKSYAELYPCVKHYQAWAVPVFIIEEELGIEE